MAHIVACSSDRPQGEEVQRTGTLELALQATAASGAVYRLRDAFFVVESVRTGQTIDVLSSEEVPSTATELRRLLNTGNFTVTLEEGWFLERVSRGSGGSGGSGGTGGMGKGGTGGSGAEGGEGMDEEHGFGGDSGEEPVRVEAFLLSDAVQFFSLFGGDEAFVSYLFQVGGEVIDFNRGTLRIGIDVIEDPSVCEPPPGVLDQKRVLLETHVEALTGMTLGDVFTALAQNGGMAADADLLYRQIYDSYASEGNATIDDAIHCGDEVTNGQPSLNGFPIVCDRVERFHVDDQFSFFQTAFVNRMDLAPQNGAHCGQQRLIFASNSINRAFMIVEAQIPNPHPEIGILGCAPLAEFWRAQNDIDDPVERGERLSTAFLVGDPDLQAEGFGPFLTATNLTVGSGQIRTNQFDDFPWTLREFKLALNGDNLSAIPFPTAESPPGVLWNDGIDTPQGDACRQSFLAAADQLMGNDLGAMSFVVDSACKDAESRNDFSQDYQSQLGDGFRAELDTALAGTGLSADDFANRAQFVGSCIGCHEEAVGKFLGNGLFAPFSNGFVHVQEFPVQCAANDPELCFQPSQALTDVFLPSRLQVMGEILDIPIIVDPCTGSSGGTSGGFGGSFGVGGSFGFGGAGGVGSAGAGGGVNVGGNAGSIGSAGAGDMDDAPEPAPVVVIELPAADEPVEDLQEQEEEIRDQYGERTLSGRSARSTH